MKNKSSTFTIGIDLGDRKHAVCVLDAKGQIVKQESIANSRGSLTALSRRYPGALMVMEVGMHSPWTSRFLKELGHRVLVANPRKVSAIHKNIRKSDRNDAELLARLARSDEKLLSPVEHVSEEMQRDLLQIKLRDNLVRQRVDIISSVRFTLKSLGITLPSPNSDAFAKKARATLGKEHSDMLALIEPSLAVLDAMTEQIRALEKSIEAMAAEKYPEREFLTQIPGVGLLTSLTFILTIGDPTRFPRKRDVAAFLGLVPRRDQTGETDKQLRISKAGRSLNPLFPAQPRGRRPGPCRADARSTAIGFAPKPPSGGFSPPVPQGKRGDMPSSNYQLQPNKPQRLPEFVLK